MLDRLESIMRSLVDLGSESKAAVRNTAQLVTVVDEISVRLRQMQDDVMRMSRHVDDVEKKLERFSEVPRVYLDSVVDRPRREGPDATPPSPPVRLVDAEELPKKRGGHRE